MQNSFVKKLFSLCFLLTVSLPAFANTKQDIPEQLQPWVPWVMSGQEEKLCSRNLTAPFSSCIWPGPLALNITDSGAAFEQTWKIEAPAHIILPGDNLHWPATVTINDEPAPLVTVKNKPACFIKTAGKYFIKGNFTWEELPELLALPAGTALISPFVINGVHNNTPVIYKNSLWLKKQQSNGDKKEQDHLHLQVYRKIDDSIPLQVTTRIELQASGQAREIVLGWHIPDNQLPLKIVSPLPARLEQDGRLRLQIKPGQFVIDLITRATGPVSKLKRGKITGPWPNVEFWSFQARNNLRMVALTGLAPIDPSQTSIPVKWRSLPAFQVTDNDTLLFEEKKRGLPDPPPNELSLERTMWLDFNGQGMTVKDEFKGTISRGWRLTTQAPFTLGRMTINDEDRLITQTKDSSQPGIEVRQGNFTATAVSRLDLAFGAKTFPAVGWQEKIKKLQISLNLPPGWRLLHATGVDRANTWLSRWTLLDIFVVLVTTLAAFKLFGPVRSLLLLFTLILIYHETGAPRFVWLVLMAVVGIRQILPAGKAHTIFSMTRIGVLVFLIIVLIPFSVQQIRSGLYPQLEKSNTGRFSMTVPPRKAAAPMMDMELDGAAQENRGKARDKLASVATKTTSYSSRQNPYKKERLDTNALIQSGPGLPHWQWQTINLGWNGPVGPTANVHLYLLPPAIKLALHFIQIGLLWLLLFLFADMRKGKTGLKPSLLSVLIASAVLYLAMPNPSQASNNFPSQNLLNELQQRLLEPPECAPDCAALQKMRVKIVDNTLSLNITASGYSAEALALPHSPAVAWSQISIDNSPAPIFKQDDKLWIRIPKGDHSIGMHGVVSQNQFHLILPHKPHLVEYIASDAWQVNGLLPNGAVENQLQFQKLQSNAKKSSLEIGALPPLLRVERTIHFGIEWSIVTQIKRLSPSGSPVSLQIPLLKGESLTSNDYRIEDNKVLSNLAPDENEKIYHSVYALQDTIDLKAPADVDWFTVWVLDISPRWHVAVTGLPPVRHLDSGIWQPRFYPYAGESIHLTVSQPESVKGTTKTIESSKLVAKPGLRETEFTLTFTIRSTRGDQLPIRLPPDSELLSVSVDGRNQPIPLTKGEIIIPLSPSTQEVAISWRGQKPISMLYKIPAVDLGIASVNATTEIQPGNRWIWFTAGPRIGPAVLFYSELVIIIIVAVLLGRLAATPLKTWQWLLLGLGLSQSGLVVTGLLVAWFLCFTARKRYGSSFQPLLFNCIQAGLVALTCIACIGLIYAVQNGLLGSPDMLIFGNNSSNHFLRWYQDRIGTTLPQPMVISFSMLSYRLVMLLWALWLAFSLLAWVKWGWNCFSDQTIWKRVHALTKKNSNKKTVSQPEKATAIREEDDDIQEL